MAYSRFIGYDKGENGSMVINEEEAKVIRLIYGEFLAGLSYHAIADRLTSLGIKTPDGKSKWSQSTVKSILQNEKYKGDALLQKSYTPDFLTKKQVVNNGEVPSIMCREVMSPSSSRRFLTGAGHEQAAGFQTGIQRCDDFLL